MLLGLQHKLLGEQYKLLGWQHKLLGLQHKILRQEKTKFLKDAEKKTAFYLHYRSFNRNFAA